MPRKTYLSIHPKRQPSARTPRTPRTPTSGLLLVLAITIAAWGSLLPGCNILGPALYLAHGPEKIKQLVELDKERPVVIFLDDRAGVIRNARLRDAITTTASQELLDHEVVDHVIDSKAVAAVVSHEPRSDLLPISVIGQKVNADIVIYVEPEVFTLSPDNQTYIPTAKFEVKIIDAQDDSRIWPDKPEGYTFSVSAHTKQGAPPSSASARNQAEQEFAVFVGQRLAQMFYSHEKTSASDSRTHK